MSNLSPNERGIIQEIIDEHIKVNNLQEWHEDELSPQQQVFKANLLVIKEKLKSA